MTKLFNKQTKRITAVAVVLLAILLFAPSAFAAPAYTAPGKVTVGADGAASIKINVSVTGLYAGAQLELILGSGVTIKSVSFNKGGGANVIPPTYARGSYFFSLFSGENGYQGDFSCTVIIEYAGTTPSTVTVNGIQSYCVNGPGNVSASVDDTVRTVAINPYVKPTDPPPDDGGGDSQTPQPGGTGTAGPAQMGTDGETEEDEGVEFNLDITDDGTGGVTEDDGGRTPADIIEDILTPVAEFLADETVKWWLWMIIVFVSSAVAATVTSEIRRKKKLKGSG